MKVYLSFDFEGVAGIVDWAQCGEGTAAYDTGCALTLGEVNAAISAPSVPAPPRSSSTTRTGRGATSLT